MKRSDGIVREAERLRREHGYDWRTAFAMAELEAAFSAGGILLVAADDVPNISIHPEGD